MLKRTSCRAPRTCSAALPLTLCLPPPLPQVLWPAAASGVTRTRAVLHTAPSPAASPRRSRTLQRAHRSRLWPPRPRLCPWALHERRAAAGTTARQGAAPSTAERSRTSALAFWRETEQLRNPPTLGAAVPDYGADADDAFAALGKAPREVGALRHGSEASGSKDRADEQRHGEIHAERGVRRRTASASKHSCLWLRSSAALHVQEANTRSRTRVMQPGRMMLPTWVNVEG